MIMSTFSIIGTPIGNLEDITLRALRIFKEADIIVCEDTRVTKRLLEHYNISKPLLSYDSQSKLSRTDEIINLLISDAGTPGISDPGALLVSKIRMQCAEQIASGQIKIEGIPGPSALTTALSIAGVPCAEFTFLGFLPHKKGRQTLFKEIMSSDRTYVFYESPHRIMKTLESLSESQVIGGNEVKDIKGKNKKLATNISQSNKKVTICRELTKIFEEVVSGEPASVLNYFKNNEDKVRGEFVVIVSGK